MGTIILFKATSSEDENSFESLLTKANFEVLSVKTLDFTFTNLEDLRTCLYKSGKYAGIVFTSPRCVTSVRKALKGDPLPDNWRTKKNYGVGPKTVECARVELRLECLGAEAGDAANLGDIIAWDLSSAEIRPFLCPRGNLAKDTLRHKVSTHYVVVYKTIPNSNLEQELLALTDNYEKVVDYAVFFSPSGVKAVHNIFAKIKHDKLKIIAIGPTTEACLKESHIPVHGTAEKPSAESLIALLNTFNTRRM